MRKYARVHKIKTKPKLHKEELAAAVSRHFANQTVKELDTITCFLYTAHYKGKATNIIQICNIILQLLSLDSVLRLPLHL